MTDPTLTPREQRRAAYEACAIAGMTFAETALALGVSISAVSSQAKRQGLTFADGRKSDAHAERMRARRADPEFAKAHAERMRARNADPEFAKASAERMRARHADPARNPLVLLSPAERADYDILTRKGGKTRNDALAAVGRDDLVTRDD